jgi:hypothetical protein
MGNIDKMIRLIIAVIISILFLTEIISGTLGIVLVGISVIFLLTSLINFCPLYALFGISTCKKM